MEDRDKEKIQKNLGRLVQRTTWTDQLEQRLIENKVFSAKLLVPIKEREGSDRLRDLYLNTKKRGPKAFAK